MSKDQLQQNKRQQTQQSQQTQQERQTQRASENDGGQYFSGLRQEEKSSVAEMLAAAEAVFNGAYTVKAAEAASYFGNQVMLRMAEQSTAQKVGIGRTADVLGGERDCVFAENSPLNDIETESAFPLGEAPFFSTEVPAADIQQVGALCGEYLI